MLKIGGLRTLVGLFSDNVQTAADKPFLRFGDRAFSYGETARLADRVSASLGAAGVGRGSRVALSLGNRPAFVTALLGALARGATVVPLNTLYKPDEIRYAVEHARCSAILTEAPLMDGVEEARDLTGRNIPLLLADDGEEGAFGAPSGDPQDSGDYGNPAATDLAGVFYTSGTTARPKGVMISHENILYSAEVTIKSLGLNSADVPLLAFPLFHVNSLFYGIFTAIVLQGAVGLVSGFSVSAYWRDAARLGATWTPGITGPLVQLLLDRPESGADRRHAMRLAVGGMFRSIGQTDAFRERFGVSLVPGWSMTETVSLGTLHPVQRPARLATVTGIGYPTLGQEIRLVNDSGDDVGAGGSGEMLYRSPSMFGGYLDDEEATRQAFTADGWFRTGDVARMDETGYLAFMDRKKDMIKSKGENVAAAEVERVLLEHPAVAEAAVIGVPEREGVWGERIEAYVVPSADAGIDQEALQRWAGQRLADFKVPRVIHFVDGLPKTALGKIQRQQLRRRDG